MPNIGHCLSSRITRCTLAGSSISAKNIPRYPNPLHRSTTFARRSGAVGVGIAATLSSVCLITGAHSLSSLANRPAFTTRIHTDFGNEARHFSSTRTAAVRISG